MRNSAVIFLALAVAAIAPTASYAQQNSQYLISRAKASGETNIAEVRLDPAAPGASGEQPRQADRLLMEAIAANDGTAATGLLASEFTWIDRDGAAGTSPNSRIGLFCFPLGRMRTSRCASMAV